MVEKTSLIPKKWGWMALGALFSLQVFRVFAFPIRGDEVFPLLFGQIPKDQFLDAWAEGFCPSPLHFLWCWVWGFSSWWAPRLVNLVLWWIGAGIWGLFFNRSEERRRWFFPWLLLGACSDLGLLAATDGQWYIWVWLLGGVWFSQWNKTVARQWKHAASMGVLLGFGGVITLLLPLVFGLVQIRKAGPFALQILTGTLVYSLFQQGGFSADWSDLFHFGSRFSFVEVLDFWRSNSGLSDPIGGLIWFSSLVLFFFMKDTKWRWLGWIGIIKIAMSLAMILVGWSPLENRTWMVLEWGAPLVFAMMAVRFEWSGKWLVGLLLIGGLSQVGSILHSRDLAQKEWAQLETQESLILFDDRIQSRSLVGWARVRWQLGRDATFVFDEESTRGEFLGGLADAAGEKSWVGTTEKEK